MDSSIEVNPKKLLPRVEHPLITTINDLTTPIKNNLPSRVGFPDSPGRTIGNSSGLIKDYNAVRDLWANKFPTKTPTNPLKNSRRSSVSSSSDVPSTSSGSSNGSKRRSSVPSYVIPEKVPKVVNLTERNDPNKVECPVCSEKFSNDLLNNHLDQCLNQTEERTSCDKNIPKHEYEKHISGCSGANIETIVIDHDIKKELEEPAIVPSTSQATSSRGFEKCSVCNERFEGSVYAAHLEVCLQGMYQSLENAYVNKATSCPVCEKEVLEREMSEHLENCQDLSGIFDDNATEPMEVKTEGMCPICFKTVPMKEINSHVNVCLAVDGS